MGNGFPLPAHRESGAPAGTPAAKGQAVQTAEAMGAGAWGVGGLRGEGPAGRPGGTTSRRQSRVLILALAAGAAGAGAVLGLVRQPDPGRQIDAFAFTATAAVEAARHAESRARSAEEQLAAARQKLEQLTAFGAAQEMADVQEAERLGLPRFMKDSTALWGDERREVMAAIVRESRRNGLDPALVAAVIHVESHFDPFAVSNVGARGLMQIMPLTAQWLLRNDGVRPAHLFNPVLNIELGTAYLAQLMNRFGGDLNQALIAYNAGPTVARAIRRGTPAFERRSTYPKAVLAAYAALLTPPPQVASR